MINWIAGNWPDRFRAWSTTTATSTSRSAYFDTEELWFPECEHGGRRGRTRSYAKHNPVTCVKNWKTPMLVVHGGKDFRVVETQGIGTFTALQRKGHPQQVPATSRTRTTGS